MRRYIIIGFVVGVAATLAVYATRGSNVERATESAFGHLILGVGNIEPAQYGDRPAKALEEYEVTGQQLARALATNSEPIAFGIGALALSAKDLTADILEAEIRKELSGRPLVCANVLMHLCPSLKDACRRGLSLLDEGGRLAAVGHALLCFATLQPIDPDPDSYRADSWPSVDAEAWDFLRNLKASELTYTSLFTRSLTQARSDEEEIGKLRPVRAAKKLVFDVGQPTIGEANYAYWNKMQPKDIAAWVKSMKSPITLDVIKEKVWREIDLVVSYLVATDRKLPE